MLIFISGENDYLAQRSIKQIKEKYLTKNSDAELYEVSGDSTISSWADLLAVPLFATSRLAIIRRAGLLTDDLQEGLARILSSLPSTTVVVLWDGKKLTQNLLEVLGGSQKKISANHPSDRELLPLLRILTKEFGREPFDTEVYRELISQNGIDLWALESALFARISTGSASLEASKALEPEQFALFRLVDRKRWGDVADAVVQEYQAGKPIEMIIGAIASAIRRSKDSVQERLSRVEILSDLDLALKTGLIEQEDVIALLRRYLPDPTAKRLQWEQVWEEIHA